MADLVLRGGWQRRMSRRQLAQLARQMKLARTKLDTMQSQMDQYELQETIIADTQLKQKLEQLQEFTK